MVFVVIFALLVNNAPPARNSIMNEYSFILLAKYGHVKFFLDHVCLTN